MRSRGRPRPRPRPRPSLRAWALEGEEEETGEAVTVIVEAGEAVLLDALVVEGDEVEESRL